MTEGRRVNAAVLAKHGSSRLGGAAKPLLTLGRGSLLSRVLDVVRDAGLPALVVTNRAEEIGPACRGTGVRVIPDALEDFGPAGGLLAALLDEPRPVLLLGCDMPHLTPGVLRRLVAESGPCQATVPCLAGRPQPLCGVYEPSVAPVIRGHAGEDRFGLMRLLSMVSVRCVMEPVLGVARGGTEFRDVDTWPEYRALPGSGREARA